MKLFETLSVRQHGLSILLAILAVQGNEVLATEQSAPEPTTDPVTLMGEWCREKKRRITHYSVKQDTLFIRSGRSGQTFEADLSCNDDYTECKAKTIRGWGTPVTEVLRLDGKDMNLTRIWGGAWKDKTYNFAFTRCPKW